MNLQAAGSASGQGPSREAMDTAERPAAGGSGLEDLRQQPVPDFSELRIQARRQLLMQLFGNRGAGQFKIRCQANSR